jgi:hypothetical protein
VRHLRIDATADLCRGASRPLELLDRLASPIRSVLALYALQGAKVVHSDRHCLGVWPTNRVRPARLRYVEGLLSGNDLALANDRLWPTAASDDPRQQTFRCASAFKRRDWLETTHCSHLTAPDSEPAISCPTPDRAGRPIPRRIQLVPWSSRALKFVPRKKRREGSGSRAFR